MINDVMRVDVFFKVISVRNYLWVQFRLSWGIIKSEINVVKMVVRVELITYLIYEIVTLNNNILK